MAKKRKRYTRKWMKQPDEFLTTSSRVIDYISRHTRVFLISLVTFFFLLGTAGAVLYYKNKMDNLVAQQLAQATDLYHQKKWEESRQEYERIIRRFPRNRQIWWAKLYLGHIYWQKRDFSKAAQLYQEVSEAGSQGNRLIRGLALLGLAKTYEEWGKIEQAIKTYQELTQLNDPFFQQQAYRSLGICYEYLGEREKAQEYYRLYLSVPGTEDEVIEERLSRWEAELG